ncbi:MAG: hypothetical protein ABSG99_01245 [Sedimentisphaerales bacterium]
MNPIKWLRKNNTKVMAVVVIFIFVGFVGEAYLGRLGQRRTGQRKTIAYFADNREITNYDIALARQELEILKLLQADNILRNISSPVFRVQDLHAVLLAELLFSERTTSPALIGYIKKIIGANRYRISEKQINDIYKRSMPTEIYWLLLKNEAQLAGVRMSNENSGRQLEMTIPQFFKGATYSQLIGSIVNRQGTSEEEILTAFSNLMTVLMYAGMICTSENITSSQIMHNASWKEETIDVEFVKFDSAVFAETGDEPNEEELVRQFDKFKKFFAGDINDQNPYGFGYKLDDRVQLEYIAVKLDDVSATVTAPTQEEVEEFYQKHREEFTASAPSDPNDPNSPPIKRVKSYGEVAGVISKGLLQNKINSEAEKILQEARTLTEAGLQATDMESAKISAEQFRQMAGDYATAAEQLSEKYKIKVYTGRTGLLSASDILMDKYLGGLFLKGYGYNPVGLTRAVFVIDELKAGELGPFDIPKPRLFENIGPAKDMLGRIMVVVRAIKAEKASEPESVNQTFAKSSLDFDEDQNQPGKEVYSIRETVVKDLKKLAAMDTTKNKAQEFIDLAVKDGWENAVDKFNKLYGPQDKSREDADAFELQNFTNLQRTSSLELETVALQSAGNPARRLLVNKAEKENRLIGQLYSLIPQDSNTIDTLPLVMEFKPDMSYYCLKNISVKRLDQEQYDKIKALYNYKEDFIQSQSLAPVHFNPENILKRMRFRQVEKDREPADTNTQSEPQGGS